MNVNTGEIFELRPDQDIQELIARGIVPVPSVLQPEIDKLVQAGQQRVDLHTPSPLSTWAAQQRQRLRNIKMSRRSGRKRTRKHHQRLRARKR